MDPKKKYFKYRLYRNNCSLIDVDGSKFYVKDLDIFNQYYDLKDIVIVDNSVLSFAYHLHNGIPIVPYYDEDKDGSLYVVGLYLKHIFKEEDLREGNKTQINLDSFIEEAKRQKELNESIIDEKPDDEEDEDKARNNVNNTDNKLKEKTDMEKYKSKKEICADISKERVLKLSSKKTFFSSRTINYQIKKDVDLTHTKLISQSKLMKIYYEVNDDKVINEKNNTFEVYDEKGKNENRANQENDDEDDDEKDKTFDNENENKNSLKLKDKNMSDNDNSFDNEMHKIKRGFTIDDDNQIKNNSIQGKLNFIRSNFFDNFKI